MKAFILTLGIFTIIFIFATLTGSHRYVYNATDNQLSGDFAHFVPSYDDATQAAKRK